MRVGAGAGEIAGLRSQIMQGALAARLDPDAVIEAVGGAQSFANALGGDTAAPVVQKVLQESLEYLRVPKSPGGLAAEAKEGKDKDGKDKPVAANPGKKPR